MKRKLKIKIRNKAWKAFKKHHVEDKGDSADLSIRAIWSNGFNTGWNKRTRGLK